MADISIMGGNMGDVEQVLSKGKSFLGKSSLEGCGVCMWARIPGNGFVFDLESREAEKPFREGLK